MTGRRFRFALAGILVLAFAVRAVYALRWAPGLGFFGDDTFFYWTARQMAQGQGYVTPLAALFHKPVLATAEHPPLYPLLLAGLSKLGVASVAAQRMLNVTVGTITVLLVALLTRRVGGRWAALLAAVLCAIYPAFIGADGALMSETLFGALVAGTLLQALRCAETPSLRRAAALGLLIGLATLTRSEGLLLWPLLIVPVVVRLPGRRVRVLVVAAAGSAVILAPWAVRNWIAVGRPVLSDNEGITVAGANCYQTYYGQDVAGFDADCSVAAVRGLPPREREAFVSSHAQSKGIRYAIGHPARALLVGAARLAAVWGFYAPGRQVVVTGRSTGLQRAGIVMYYVLLVLGALGVGALWRSRRRDVLLTLGSPFVATSVTAVLTYGLVRLREGAEVNLLVLAAFGLAVLIEKCARLLNRPSRSQPMHATYDP